MASNDSKKYIKNYYTMIWMLAICYNFCDTGKLDRMY
jgi:hypothetical protein